MNFKTLVKGPKAKKAIKRLEGIEDEMIRFDNPKRYYLLKEIEEEERDKSISNKK